MDTAAITLSVRLALLTLLLLLPPAILAAHWLAVTTRKRKIWIEGLLALPLVLPPTVIGYYLLVAMSSQSLPGRWFEVLAGQTLAFSFSGLVVASVIFNIPFAVQPIQRAFEAIARSTTRCNPSITLRQARCRYCFCWFRCSPSRSATGWPDAWPGGTAQRDPQRTTSSWRSATRFCR